MHSNYRDFIRPDGQTRMTPFINLTKDEFYYIEARHAEWGWGDHMTVGVKIKTDASHNIPTTHHHIRKEYQHFNISAGTDQALD